MTRQTVNRISGCALALGLLAAVAVYFTAKPVPIDPLLGEPLTTKRYVRELRVMGGRANVLAAELQDWFAGLWQGESLAGTIAVLTVGGVLVFRFVTLLPPPEPAPAEPPAASPPKFPT